MQFCGTFSGHFLFAGLFLLLSFVIPAQNSPLQQYISTNTHEIHPGSKDFNGLSFLDTALKDKRIVLLGESSHGTEEYSQTKLQLIEYLHKRLGFSVVLFESPMTSGSYINMVKDSLTSDELMRKSIQHVWHTKTVLKLFDFIKENKISFGGIDPQFIPSEFYSLFFSSAFINYPEIKKDLLKLESRIAESFKNGKDYARLKDSFATAYSGIKAQLEKLSLSPLQQWAKHIITINRRYYANLNKGNERDSCMAKNVIWLAEQMYPNEKIIIWAHNSHIDKNSTSSARFMGKVLADHFGPQLYSVGLYMINGQTALNNRSIIQVKGAPNNSLEHLLSARGFKTAFVETNNSVFDKRITTLHWGKDKQVLNLSKSYDAVILVNGVSVPEYLKE